MMETGAHAIGCTVFAGGVGTPSSSAAMAELRPHGYAGTPSFLRILFREGGREAASTALADQALLSGELSAQPARLAGRARVRATSATPPPTWA